MTPTSTYSTPLRAGSLPTRPGIYLAARKGLDMLVEQGPRGGVERYYRRIDRREGPARLVSTWDATQGAARAR